MTRTIYLGGGCFWCIEAAFQNTKGIVSVEPGYMGGTVSNPTYKQVCSGLTGHAEVVALKYDPLNITLENVLRLFFMIHDPTQLNRQGNDIGSQYRSVIFCDEEVVPLVNDYIKTEVIPYWGGPVVTQVESITTFYSAELYHHNYYALNPLQAYCQLVIRPKIKKIEAVKKELNQ